MSRVEGPGTDSRQHGDEYTRHKRVLGEGEGEKSGDRVELNLHGCGAISGGQSTLRLLASPCSGHYGSMSGSLHRLEKESPMSARHSTGHTTIREHP